MKTLLPIASLVIATIALVLSLQNDTGRSLSPQAAGPTDLAALTQRVAALETEALQRPPHVELAPVQPAPARESAAAESASAERVELLERIARIETQLREQPAREPERPSRAQASARPGSSPEAIEQAVALALDASAEESERLQGLRTLRGQRAPDGTDARLAVLDEMILLAQTSAEPRARADVWRQLSGVTDVRLRQPLLDALAFDTDEDARSEAAETLEDFLPDSIVEAALRNAALNDVSSDVRTQAARSLAGGLRGS